MKASLLGFGAVAAMASTIARPAAAQQTHVVQLIGDADKQEYRFEPARLAVRPNDVVVFRVASGAPHSVVFEGGELSPGIRGAFNSALPGRSGDLSSPLLTATGKDYRMVVPQVPAGRYRFFCLPHRAYDMSGELVVQ
jgi:plastocyanin